MLNGLQGPTRAQIACAGNCKAMVFALEPSNRARHPKDQALFSAMPCDQSWNFVVSTDQALGNKLNGAVKRRTPKRSMQYFCILWTILSRSRQLHCTQCCWCARASAHSVVVVREAVPPFQETGFRQFAYAQTQNW